MNLDESISSYKKLKLNNESSEEYGPNNSMLGNYINLSKQEETKKNSDISMIFSNNSNSKDCSSEEEEEEEKEEENKDDNININLDSLKINDLNTINESKTYNLFDLNEENNYFKEMSEKLCLFEKEPPLLYNNKESFSKGVDNMIKKLYTQITDSFLQILMITEKPSIARTITKALSYSNSYIFGYNYNAYSHKKIDIYTFQGYFKEKMAHFTVTSIKGHLYDSKYICPYNEEDPVKSYDYNITKVLKNKEINIPKFLRYIAKGKDILCLWTDCDPEGENICYEIIRNVLPYMNKNYYQQVYRAIFSSLTEREIQKAFDGLREYPNCDLSMSIDARTIIDYKVGLSFSRLLTSNILNFIEENEISKKDVLSYGPCQTPALWFCVQKKKK